VPEKLGYLHVETDAELAARVRTKYPWWRGDLYRKGSELDEEVEQALDIQRRIVEVYP
jgi:hypothetical protein